MPVKPGRRAMPLRARHMILLIKERKLGGDRACVLYLEDSAFFTTSCPRMANLHWPPVNLFYDKLIQLRWDQAGSNVGLCHT
jgi:hypothetical protein